MKGLTVRVEGLSALNAALNELPKATGKAVLRRVGRKALEPMAEDARRLAPDDPTTGAPDLHRSIEISSRQKSGRQLKRTREGKATVNLYMGPTREGYPQAVMQEFGTSRHPPHPYMRPAWDANKRGALDIVAGSLGEEIAKSAARLAKKRAKAG